MTILSFRGVRREEKATRESYPNQLRFLPPITTPTALSKGRTNVAQRGCWAFVMASRTDTSPVLTTELSDERAAATAEVMPRTSTRETSGTSDHALPETTRHTLPPITAATKPKTIMMDIQSDET